MNDMHLVDYFAIKILQGMLSGSGSVNSSNPSHYTAAAYNLAEAMIAEKKARDQLRGDTT